MKQSVKARSRSVIGGGAFCAAGLMALPGLAGAQNTGPKVSWHWHMHQPIYWNDQTRIGGTDRYEYAWESIQMKDGGNPHPENDLRDIFGKDDRVAAYQYRMRDSLGLIGSHTNSGAQTSYTGALMENISSLGNAGQLGYGSGWDDAIAQAHSWTTTGGKPRLDIVTMTFHHSLTGLLDPDTIYMELKLQQEKVKEVFGAGAVSRGFFPTEMTFSTRLIPVMKRLNMDWVIVSGEHIARACPDFPLQLGSGGVNCEPPNRADQINANGTNFIRVSIDRGSSPVHANPLSYQPARVKWVDPDTGVESKVIAIPADMSQGWKDGYSCIDAGFLDVLINETSQPSFVLLSHDGDNAFGGGFSYYNECVPNLANSVSSKGGEVSTIEQYLLNFTPAESRVIHVEDGGWAYADSDFGSPTFINWNYPLLNSSGQPDPVNGWHEKPREMAVFTAMVNRVLTAQQVTGHAPDFAKILHPDGSTHAVDRAWHYYLGSLDSGNVYFGAPLDLEVKGTLGCNEAAEHVDPIIASNLANDETPPSVFLPQRFPYNPGSLNFGSGHQYQQVVDDGDFHIWTFVADVNSITSVNLKYRLDNDGATPLASNQNETYTGGGEVGSWTTLAMNGRDFPAGNVYNKPEINYFEMPLHIARHYSVPVTGIRDKLMDYYVEATDSEGNIARSAIQHVYVGDGSGAAGDAITVAPNPPVAGQSATITYDATGRNLQGAGQVKIHLGKNNWSTVVAPDPAMTGLGGNEWEYTYTVDADATQIDFVFNNGSGTWDNNGGADWHFTTGQPASLSAAFTADATSGQAPLTVQFSDQSTGSPATWAWDFDNDGTTDSTSQSPSHAFSNAGTYSVKLTVGDGVDTDEELKTNYIMVTPAPTDPAITLNKSTISVSAVVGNDAAA
ncbi:PKD domain-containing protein, partial [Candidatus Poribacteria bacterium]|nr:PKD domain-containing protein [Candidatus Poribacteria bacterium]